MSAHRTGFHRFFFSIIYWVVILSLLVSCQGNLGGLFPQKTDAAPEKIPQPPDYQKAEITFEVTLPASLKEDENLYLEILDEVTGLALNASRVQMVSPDQKNFTAKLPLVVGSVLKYRYVRDKEPAGIEYTSQKEQVRYRMYLVDGPGVVRDTVSAWKSTADTGKLGRIFGQVAFIESNIPVVNALVVAGGMHALTASDGSFIIEGLPPGTHNMVVYSPDGAFQTFQQGANIAADSTTPAFIQVRPAEMVEITFLVRPPQDGLAGLPIRMVGNFASLGNTFADLKGGVSVLASRAPLMERLPDGRYSLTMKLPAGGDLRYKYTLGDGYWNAERTSEGNVRIRQLIIPQKSTTIHDFIDTWKAGSQNPVSIDVTVPADTPSSDTLSIQFNPFGWTEAIPMWPTGNNRWFYVIYDPWLLENQVSYRYCRNEQCGIADSSDTSGADHPGKVLQISADERTVRETIPSWAWMEAESGPVVVPADKIAERPAEFTAGVAFQSGYHPNWQPYIVSAFKNIRDIGANSVILTPSWHLTHQTPPVMGIIPGHDPLWTDLAQMIERAKKNGLAVYIHPVLQYDGDPAIWWGEAARDDGWWQSWFDRYRTFTLYHADLAAQTGAEALILGDESILPALPDGVLFDGTPSNIPDTAGKRWEELITEVRSRYPGKLVWFIPYSGGLPNIPGFAGLFDQLYVQISPPVSPSDNASPEEVAKYLADRLDRDILPLQDINSQKIILGLNYPSASNMLDGCAGTSESCISIKNLEQPAAAFDGVNISFKEQANVYSAVLSAINSRDWVSGFISAGYYPPVSIKDMSPSVRGKPASDILWYWYARLLGRVNP